MLDIIRDGTLGQLVHRASSGRYLQYADQKPDYIIPDRYLLNTEKPFSSRSSSATLVTRQITPPPKALTTFSPHRKDRTEKICTLEEGDVEAEAQRQPTLSPTSTMNETSSVTLKYILVDWEENDQDNPQQWSRIKKLVVASQICLLTFAVYSGSAIYTSSIPSLMETFNVDVVYATLGLTLYVLAYGVGPMFLSPLQELPYLGRNPVYMIGLLVFAVFQLPIIYAKNFGTILAFRFLTGFVGGPALATGGASLLDVVSPGNAALALAFWSIAAVLGPTSAPVIGGFAAQANGWQWPMFELLWISSFAFLVLFCFLPETYAGTILLKRAQRLRKLTGNQSLRSQSEIDMSQSSTLHHLGEALMRPLLLCFEPAVAFANIYIGLVYSIFYLWFEAFPIVFTDLHHMNLGISTLPFLGFVVTGALSFGIYVWYNRVYLHRLQKKKAELALEDFLRLGLIASFIIPISLFIFGWTAREDIHWIFPTIGAALYLPGIYWLFQVILMYLSMGYPKYSASVLAGNDLFRSAMASAFPLFGRAFFNKLGLGGGSSLLAGLSILMIPLFWLLFRYGAMIRKRSHYASTGTVEERKE